MGFSLVSAAAIIGVAIIMSIEIMVGTTIPAITDVHDAYDKMRDRSIEQIQTDINIINVTTPANGSGYDLNFTIKNTGSITLETSYFDILINGTKYDFISSKTYLHPEKQAYFNIYNLAGNGNQTLKVVTNNGIADYYTYSIN